MTFNEMAEIVGAISYRPGWSINIFDGDRPYVQIHVSTESEASLSPFNGKREAWRSGKVFLSEHMCRQEIVGAVFGAIRSAEEHEMKEWFTYRGARIYNPHLDPDTLAEIARKKGSFNFRKNAMSMEE